MSSDLRIALIAAGSAVAGSLITGGLAYLGMRHQSKQNRGLRLADARRIAYARFLAVAFEVMNYLTAVATPVRLDRLKIRVLEIQSRTTASIGEVRILASPRVAATAIALTEALRKFVDAAFGVLSQASEGSRASSLLRGRALPVAGSPLMEAPMATLGEAASAFIESAKLELRMEARWRRLFR